MFLIYTLVSRARLWTVLQPKDVALYYWTHHKTYILNLKLRSTSSQKVISENCFWTKSHASAEMGVRCNKWPALSSNSRRETSDIIEEAIFLGSLKLEIVSIGQKESENESDFRSFCFEIRFVSSLWCSSFFRSLNSRLVSADRLTTKCLVGHYANSSPDNWPPDNLSPTTDPLDNSSPWVFYRHNLT